MNKRRVTKRVLKTNKRSTRRNKRVLSVKTRGGEENKIVLPINNFVSVTLETIKQTVWLQRGSKTISINIVSQISIHRLDDSNKKIYSIDCVYDIINKESSNLEDNKSVFSKIILTILPSNTIDFIKKNIQSDIRVITANSDLDINKILASCPQLPTSIELVITPNDDILTITPIYQPNVCQVQPTQVKANERNMERGFMDLGYNNNRSQTIMDSIEEFHNLKIPNSELFLEKIRGNMTDSEKAEYNEITEMMKDGFNANAVNLNPSLNQRTNY